MLAKKHIIEKMALIEIKLEFVKNSFDKKLFKRRLIRWLTFIYYFFVITSGNYKKESRKKKPKLLKFPLLKFSLIYGFFVMLVIPLLPALFSQGETLNIAGQVLLALVFLSLVFAIGFTVVFAIVFLCYSLPRFVRALIETVKFIIEVRSGKFQERF